MSDKQELLPCPFCNQSNKYPPLVEVFNVPWATPIYAVRCENCGATGGQDVMQKEAIKSWNTRADQAKLEAALKDPHKGEWKRKYIQVKGELEGANERVKELTLTLQDIKRIAWNDVYIGRHAMIVDRCQEAINKHNGGGK